MNRYLKYVFYLVVMINVCQARAGAYEDYFQAIRRDDAATVRALLARGFDPNAVDESGQPALTLMAREGALLAADVLLTHPGLKIDAANTSGETALMLAALKGHAGLVTRMLERGAAVNRTGWSPLHYAATGPNVDIVRLLLDRGAAIDARSPNGSTPLMMAAQFGPEESVTLLLARGANARLRNERGLSAADFARLAAREKLALQLDALLR